MSDIVYDSDEYHDDYLPDLHREGSLPDLVLSSSLGRDTELFSSMDLTSSTPSHVYDVPTDIESEYFTTLDQVTTTCGEEGIRVSYEDHSKIYIPKISTSDNYRSYLNLTMPSDEESGDEPIKEQFQSLSPENQARQRQEWSKDLAKTDAEMEALLVKLKEKTRHAQILKRKLGLTAWREFSDDMKEGVRKLRESPMYHKVETTLNETMVELTNLVVSGDDYMLKTLDNVEESVEKAFSIASDGLKKATKKTSEGLLSAQRKASHSLQKLGVLDPPKMYRKDDIPIVIEDSKVKDEITE